MLYVKILACLEEGRRATKNIKIFGALLKIQNGYLPNTNQMLLTYSMVQSPREANWFAASQEIPRI